MIISEQLTSHHISQLAERHFTIIDDFISLPELLQVANYLSEKKSSFKKAGVGTSHLFTIDKQVRGDYIDWIDKETAPDCLSSIMDRMEGLKDLLNQTCFLGLKALETHLTFYPEGTRYERHLDQLQLNDSRKITFIIYLNHQWKSGDGGELIIYSDQGSVPIAPKGGRLVLFRSNMLEHEVLTTSCERYSITGWLLDQPVGLTFLHQR